MNKTITMIRIVAGLGENENIIKASNELNEIDDLEITLVKTEDELIEAFKNPEIDAVIRGSLKASKVVKEIRYVGWDIAITDKGPVIIEGNEYPGHDIYQLPVHRTNNIGVLPKFEEALGKIEDLK